MKKGILIVDDSALMRRILSDIVETDKRFAVTGLAANGLEALDLIIKDKRKYDIILLDINMPIMNGLELLEKMIEYNIRTKVIIISTLATEGAKETIRALELGAFDFVQKPNNFVEIKRNEFKEKVIESLLVASELEELLYTDQNILVDKKNKKDKKSDSSNNKIIALACSTGGPKALHSVIPRLPKDLDASVVIVQHMPEGFTHSLSDRLNDLSEINVKEAKDGEVLEKGVVYIAKGGSHLKILKTGSVHKLIVQKGEPVRGLMPCADLMYNSLADSDYDEIICVVLTGMGSDGTEGIKRLSKDKPIYVIAQNEETSVVYGMPRAIYNSGLVDEVLPLNKVVDRIMNRVGGN